MKRLVFSDLAYIERLFAGVPRKPRTWSKALYPPGCDPRRGSVEFRSARGEAVVLQVERRSLDAKDFQLTMMFAVGTGVFPTPQDLHKFARGPLARAFGIDLPSSPADEPEPDLQLVIVPEPPSESVLDASAEAGPAVVAGADSERAESREKPSLLQPSVLAKKLRKVVKGQDAALERVAHVVCSQIAKEAPARPATLLLVGPTGTGKTSTIEALPRVLKSLGFRAHLFRVDCNELTHSFQVSRLIGAPPGYVGYKEKPALISALEKPGCILLLDEIDKAHRSVVGEVLLNLLDTGKLTAGDGRAVDAADAMICMTSNLAAAKLAKRLENIPLDNRWAVQRVCRQVFAKEGMAPELLGRIGAFALYRPLDEQTFREAALLAIKSVAGEYAFRIARVEPVIPDVVLDIAGENGLGARALHYAASELLADAFVAARARGVESPVTIKAGPPIAVVGRPRSPKRPDPSM